MKRQVIIRGSAIAFAGIAASIFVAGEFLQDPPTPVAGNPQGIETAPGMVKGASLIGAGSNGASESLHTSVTDHAALRDGADDPAPSLIFKADAQPAAEYQADPDLAFSALDWSLHPATEQVLYDDFRPELALVDAGSMDDASPCTPSLDVTALPDAMLGVHVSAPCQENGRIVISHGDMAYSARLDASGDYVAQLPALHQDAGVDVFLADDSLLQKSVRPIDLDRQHRVVLQWMGDVGIGLHAFHDNAGFGELGHIHAGNPFAAEPGLGRLITLGDRLGLEPMLVQVYSVAIDRRSSVRLELEVSLDQRNCGRELQAHIVQIAPDVPADLRELRVATPDCDAMTGAEVAVLPVGLQLPADAADSVPGRSAHHQARRSLQGVEDLQSVD